MLGLGEQPGEVRASGPQIMSGYRNAPEETAQALRDGWLHTGDIGAIDDDGALSIRGRKKEMVIVGGYNVFPREVEDVPLSFPGVSEAAVVGMPDSYRGESVRAFVIRRSAGSIRRPSWPTARRTLPATRCRPSSSWRPTCRKPPSVRSTRSL